MSISITTPYVMSDTTPLISASTAHRLRGAPLCMYLFVLLLNTFLAAFESTIAASTLSAVGDEFQAGSQTAWVATSYLIVSTAVQPLYGRASDVFGRSPAFVFSLLWFALGCLGSGVSGDLFQMILARALCGIGGAGLITMSQICAWDVLPRRWRAVFQASNNLTYGLGAAMGASVGGLLTETVGWRWGYFIPAPLSLFSAVMILVFGRSGRLVKSGEGVVNITQVDLLGGGTLMLTVGLLVALISLPGEIISTDSPWIPVGCAVLAGLAVCFGLQERRVKVPILPFRLVATRHMAGQVGLNLFGAMTIFATLYIIPVYFQTVQLQSAAIASRRLLYPTIAAPLASIGTGIVLHRLPNAKIWGQRLGVCLLLMGSIGLFAMTYQHTNTWSEPRWASRLVGVHLGMGTLFISSLLDILDAAGSEHASASSLIFMIRSIGTVLGVAISQAALHAKLRSELVKSFGPGELAESLQTSIGLLQKLDRSQQRIALACFNVAFRKTFAVIVSFAIGASLAAIIGVRARRFVPVE